MVEIRELDCLVSQYYCSAGALVRIFRDMGPTKFCQIRWLSQMGEGEEDCQIVLSPPSSESLRQPWDLVNSSETVTVIMTSSCHHAVCGHFFKVSDRA